MSIPFDILIWSVNLPTGDLIAVDGALMLGIKIWLVRELLGILLRRDIFPWRMELLMLTMLNAVPGSLLFAGF
jgi:hypothetical protein